MKEIETQLVGNATYPQGHHDLQYMNSTLEKGQSFAYYFIGKKRK